MSTITPDTPHRRAWVKITRRVTVLYDLEGSIAQPWPLAPEGVLGNVFGHTRGVELYPHRDGTVTVILRGTFVEQWSRIPQDALELGPTLP